MGHDHAHDHGSENAYYVEQLFTIAVCGAIGGVMVMMYFNGMVVNMFGDKTTVSEVQHSRVLLGGAGLLTIVLVRAIYVWFAVGKQPAGHSHDHGDCGHDHGDCGHEHHDHHDHHHHHEHEEGIKAAPAVTSLALAPAAHSHSHDHGHDHGHDHDHAWAPWRFVLLLLPVILFFLGMPNKGFTALKELNLNESDAAALKNLTAQQGGDILPMTFLQLEQASFSRDAREGLAGKTIRVTGQYAGNDPHRFTLQRYKVNCCAADAIPLKAVIAINPGLQDKYRLDPAQYQGKWVEVTGRLQFLQLQESKQFVTAVILDPSDKVPLTDLVKIVPPDPNPYAN